MTAHSQEGQRQDLNQEAELRAQVPPLCMPVTQGGGRGETWVFSGDRIMTIITILFLEGQVLLKALLLVLS